MIMLKIIQFVLLVLPLILHEACTSICSLLLWFSSQRYVYNLIFGWPRGFMVLCPRSWRKMPTYIGCCLHLCLCLLLRTHTFLGALLHFISLRFLMWVPLGVPQQWPRHGKHWPANGANVEFFSNCFCLHWNLTWIDYSHALRIWEDFWTQIRLTINPRVLFLDLLDLCLTSRYQID